MNSETGSKDVDLVRTRRWGENKGSNMGKTHSNNFVPIAPSWFYSLVGLFMQRKDDLSLWSGHLGATLLSRFLSTLTVIVESCANQPGTEVMSVDLFELAWGFREAEISAVRVSVLHALGSSLQAVRGETLVSLLSRTGSAEALPRYLQTTAENDPDEDCRALARGIGAPITLNRYICDW